MNGKWPMNALQRMLNLKGKVMPFNKCQNASYLILALGSWPCTITRKVNLQIETKFDMYAYICVWSGVSW